MCESVPAAPALMEQHVDITVRVLDDLGLHARPAARLARTALAFEADVLILHEDMTVDAKSILDILTLAATRGTDLTISCRGVDAAQAAETLQLLFARPLAEEKE